MDQLIDGMMTGLLVAVSFTGEKMLTQFVNCFAAGALMTAKQWEAESEARADTKLVIGKSEAACSNWHGVAAIQCCALRLLL